MISEALTYIKGKIDADATLGAFQTVLYNDPTYDATRDAALRDTGLCMVVIPTEGTNTSEHTPIKNIENGVMVVVAENPQTNATGRTASDLAELLIDLLHQAEWQDELGKRHTIRSRNPVWQMGPLDVEPVLIFVNFTYKSIRS